MTILDQFPLEKPRNSQIEVLKAIEQAFSKGYKNVLLEAPVGSGKSAIAVACAKFYGSAHILTPRKSLQDQYTDDFSKEDLVSMKGRSGYICTHLSEETPQYDGICNKIRDGKVVFVPSGTLSCAEGPCLHNQEVKRTCTKPVMVNQIYDDTYPCPYSVASATAQKSSIVVHNLHSFIFQTYFAEKFQRRDILICDEAHQMEGVLRGFAEKKFTLPLFIRDDEVPADGQYKTMAEWAGYFDGFCSAFSSKAKANGSPSAREEFESILIEMEDISDTIGEKFVVSIDRDSAARRSRFLFTPEFVGNLAEKYILNFGEKRLLMSGTIYNKEMFCRLNGLKSEETCFIKIGSSFPKVSRPIYIKPEYTIDTSHKMWDTNFRQMIENIKKVMDVFPEEKGLIHAPSYQASLVVYNALKSTGRIVMHDKDNFQETLLEFYKDKNPNVIISPICSEGVDFKGERARFQMILRVPYPNANDPLMAKKYKEDYGYVNYKALVTFGQQIGRVNRSETDFGVTVLMDSRFESFIYKNKSLLPGWVKEALIY